MRKRLKAYALGWMTHLATDVTGHPFVNEKSGGPYRTHWQRHHLVENHMDALVYDTNWKASPRVHTYGNGDTTPIYQMLSCSALHLWVAFEGEGPSKGASVTSFIDDEQPGDDYSPGDDAPSIASRRKAWDEDANLPKDLATFIADALRAFYQPILTDPRHPHRGHVDIGPQGQCAAHPTIIKDIDQQSSYGKQGFVSPEAVDSAYWWAFHYLKAATTDYFLTEHPQLKLFNLPSCPVPPWATTNDPPPPLGN